MFKSAKEAADFFKKNYLVNTDLKACRLPSLARYIKSPEEKRFENRTGAATTNPYLMFSAMILAGVNGNIDELAEKEGRKLMLRSHSYEFQLSLAC